MKPIDLHKYFTNLVESTVCDICNKKFKEFVTSKALTNHLKEKHGDVLQ